MWLIPETYTSIISKFLRTLLLSLFMLRLVPDSYCWFLPNAPEEFLRSSKSHYWNLWRAAPITSREPLWLPQNSRSGIFVVIVKVVPGLAKGIVNHQKWFADYINRLRITKIDLVGLENFADCHNGTIKGKLLRTRNLLGERQRIARRGLSAHVCIHPFLYESSHHESSRSTQHWWKAFLTDEGERRKFVFSNVLH